MQYQCVLYVALAVVTSRYVVFGLVSQTIYSFNGDMDTYFELYTPKSPEKPLVLNVNNASSITLYSNYDPTLPMKVLVHGWFGTKERAAMFHQKMFTCGQMNIVSVQWYKGSNTYVTPLVEFNVAEAGRALATFLSIVAVQTGLDMSKVSMVGHGFGAAIAGEAGRRIGNVSSILGLDASWSLLSRSLNRNDANYVQAIHTSALLGSFGRVGDADFYVNGNNRQPGCHFYDLKCAHLYAADLYYDSLCESSFTGCRKGHKGDCGYVMAGFNLHMYSGVFEVRTSM